MKKENDTNIIAIVIKQVRKTGDKESHFTNSYSKASIAKDLYPKPLNNFIKTTFYLCRPDQNRPLLMVPWTLLVMEATA